MRSFRTPTWLRGAVAALAAVLVLGTGGTSAQASGTRTAAPPSFRILQLNMCMWGLTTVARFISESQSFLSVILIT
jgi:hypothetical protein